MFIGSDRLGNQSPQRINTVNKGKVPGNVYCKVTCTGVRAAAACVAANLALLTEEGTTGNVLATGQ